MAEPYIERTFKDGDKLHRLFGTPMQLKGKSFILCHFISLNMTDAILAGGTYSDVSFTRCKLIGANIENVHFTGEVSFSGCNLSRANMKGMRQNGRLVPNDKLIDEAEDLAHAILPDGSVFTPV